MSFVGSMWHLGHDPESGDFEWWEYHGPHLVKRWWKRRVAALTYMLAGDGDTVLILGCGSSPSINRYVNDNVVVGVDHNPAKLRFLAPRTSATLLRGDITQPLAIPHSLPQKYDRIICNEALEHLPPGGVEIAVKTMCGRLGEKGRVVISIPDESHSKVGGIVERVLHGDIHKPITMEKIRLLMGDKGLVEVGTKNHLWVRVSCFTKHSS